ncbi:MAG: hypothetical protein QW035_03120 [Candidatus Anstonellales archaeon]
MDPLEKARQLIDEGKLRDALDMLAEEVKRNEHPEMWYLMGLSAMLLEENGRAMEYFQRANALKRSVKYTNGMAYLALKLGKIKTAYKHALEGNAIEENVDSCFVAFVCLLFMNDPRSKDYIKKAYALDKQKTIKLVSQFYEKVIKRSPEVSDADKREIEAKIRKIIRSNITTSTP